MANQTCALNNELRGPEAQETGVGGGGRGGFELLLIPNNLIQVCCCCSYP